MKVKTSEEVVGRCLLHLDEIDKLAASLESVVRFLAMRPELGDGKEEFKTLRLLLSHQRMWAYRELFAWGLTVDEATRDRLKALAYDQLYQGGNSVAHLVSEELTSLPSKWLTADEDAFRAMAKKAFSPRGGE